MNASIKTLLVTVLSSLCAAGCGGSAQLVRADALGGHVALEGPFMPAMSDARLLMAEHCQGRFEAVERQSGADFRCLRDDDATLAVHVAVMQDRVTQTLE
jgi:hypothetical protein